MNWKTLILCIESRFYLFQKGLKGDTVFLHPVATDTQVHRKLIKENVEEVYMRKKRVLAILLSAVMAAGVFTGCGSSGNDENKQENNQTQPAASVQENTGKDTDNTGENVSSGTDAQEFTYPMETGANLTYWCELNQNVSANFSNLGDTPFGKEWQKETGVTIEFQHPPANQGSEQFSLLLADGELPDLMEYAWMSYPGGPEKAITDGNIYELTDIINDYCPNLRKYLDENPDIDRMVKTDEGHYYCFPFIRGDDKLCNTIGLMLRKDWLEELNLEVPTTIDEWHDVLVAFRDEKGAAAPLCWEYTMGALTSANSFTYAYDSCRDFYLGSDGKVHYGPAEEGYRQYLELFHQWYGEKLIDQDLATLALDQVSAKITSGEAGASIGWAGSRMGTWINAAVQTNPDYMLVAAPYPTLNKGDRPKMGQIDNRYELLPGVMVESLIIPQEKGHIRIHHIWTKEDIELADGGFAIRAEDGINRMETSMVQTTERAVRCHFPWGNAGAENLEGDGEARLVTPFPNTNLMYGITVIPTIYFQLKAGSTV